MKQFYCLVLLVLLCGFSTNAQMRVTGTVTEAENGRPIAFATVAVKNAVTAVTTGEDGSYAITVPDGNAVLIYSFFGMKTREEAVGGRSIINVMLESEAVTLEETIVVAYGTASKGTYTGAASVVKQEDIKDVPTLSFQNALGGKVAGLQVSTSSGMAGAAPEIRIRGTGSMNASNEPLYVIDGVPVTSGVSGQLSDVFAANMNNIMSTLNPADIENMTVLKDAAASALYGSRAANGVIIITTKKGKQGRPRVDFRASVALSPSFATDNWERAGEEEQIEMYYQMFWDGEISKGNTAAAASTTALRQLNDRFNRHGYAFSAPDNTVSSLTITDYDNSGRAGQYFDWEDALFRTSVYQTYEASISGGTESTTYYTSLGYTQEDGRVKKNGYERISGRLNLTQKIGKVIEVGSNVNFARTRNVGFNDSRNTSTNMFMQVRNLLWGMYWPTDYSTGEPWTNRYGSYAYNNIYYNDQWTNSAKTLRVSVIENVTVNILPELKFRTTLSYDNISTKDFLYYSALHFSGASNGGEVRNYHTNTEKTVSSSVLDFGKTIEKHKVSALVGWEAERNKTTFQRATGTNLANSTIPSVSTAGVKDAAGYWWGDNMLSFLSRVEYSYNDKYYLSGSYRRDASSRLSPETRWGDFWSVAGSWRISNEKFMQNIEWLSNLRLRASYGVNGTLPSGSYAFRALVGYTYRYMEEPGGQVTTKPDSQLKWETSYTANLALEFGLLKNRITGTVEFFNRDSKNLLNDVPVSMVTGIYNSQTLTNIGEINNKGVEIELWGNILATGDFRWDMGITASLYKSEVTELYGGQDIIGYTDVDSYARRIYRVGESPLSFYGLEWGGVEAATGKQIWYTNNTTSDFLWNGRAATYDYRKASEIVIGNADPTMYGGINTDFSWKDISLGLNFMYKIGGEVYDGVSRDVTDDGYYWERIRSQDQYDNRWTVDNMNSVYPQMLAIDMEDVNQRSSRFIHDGSFIRLKSITLSYNLPKSIVEKAKMSSARVYFNGANLLTWASYGLYDPEVAANGVKTWAMPLGKTYTFGVEISF